MELITTLLDMFITAIIAMVLSLYPPALIEFMTDRVPWLLM